MGKAAKKSLDRTVVASLMGGEINHIAKWKRIEHCPIWRTNCICNGETNAMSTIIGLVLKHVYGFVDATLKAK